MFGFPMLERYSDWKVDFPMSPKPSLKTGVGHGHSRRGDRERPAKDKIKKLRKHTKMAKASKRRNRK